MNTSSLSGREETGLCEMRQVNPGLRSRSTAGPSSPLFDAGVDVLVPRGSTSVCRCTASVRGEDAGVDEHRRRTIDPNTRQL